MAITYDATNDIITVGSGTQTSPVSFDDVYQASVDGGWGVVEKQGDNQFIIHSHFNVVNGWLKSTNEHIVFDKDGFVMKLYYSNSGIEFGELDPYGNAVNGCIIDVPSESLAYIMEYSISRIGNLYIIGSIVKGHNFRIYARTRSTANKVRIIESILDLDYIIATGSGVTFSKNTFQNINLRIYVENQFELFKDNVINYADKFIYIDTYATTDVYYLYDTVLKKSNDTVAPIEIRTTTEERHVHFRNVYLPKDDWTIVWNLSRNGSYLHREYSFDPVIVDENTTPVIGATIELIDKDGNIVHSDTTGVDGKMLGGMIYLEMGWYNYDTRNTLNTRNPYTIKITKTGEIDFEAKFSITDKMENQIFQINPVENVHSFDDVYNAVIGNSDKLDVCSDKLDECKVDLLETKINAIDSAKNTQQQ